MNLIIINLAMIPIVSRLDFGTEAYKIVIIVMVNFDCWAHTVDLVLYII